MTGVIKSEYFFFLRRKFDNNFIIINNILYFVLYRMFTLQTKFGIA